MEQKTRDYNMELFRIFAMFLVIVQHCVLHSNLVDTLGLSGLGFTVDFIKNFSNIANSCFLLISGYYMINSKFNLKKIFCLWGKTLFYSIAIWFAYFFVTSSVQNAYDCFFPFLSKHYWFITMYICLYFIAPLLNIFAKKISKPQFKYLMVLLTIFFEILGPFFSFSNLFFGVLGSIIYMYLLGAYIRLHLDINTKKSYYFVKFITMIFIVTLLRYLMNFAFAVILMNNWNKSLIFTFNNFREGLVSFSNIFLVLAALSLFLKFKTINVNRSILQKTISFVSPSMFSLYLIHEHINNRDSLWIDVFNLPQFGNSFILIIYILLSSILVFLICLAIDLIRRCIYMLIKKAPFMKVLIDKLNGKIDIISKKVQRIFDKSSSITQLPVAK